MQRWTPEEFWDRLANLIGVFEADALRHATEKHGLCISYRPADSAESTKLPPKHEIQTLIEGFIAPDLDTERAFASHRRSWLVQCLQFVLTQIDGPPQQSGQAATVDDLLQAARLHISSNRPLDADRLIAQVQNALQFVGENR